MVSYLRWRMNSTSKHFGHSELEPHSINTQIWIWKNPHHSLKKNLSIASICLSPCQDKDLELTVT